MFGFLNICKPGGWTSRDVVNRVQRLVRPVKVGHAGTLDPLATGVLVVALGPATRLIEYVQQYPKQYQAGFLLGRTSPSDDIESEVSLLANVQEPSQAALEALLPQFTGRIQQTPPAYSAVKVGGQRAYALARRGETVDLHSREVHIHCLRINSYDFPELRLDIECGSGTYVRSLGRDLARAAGSAAVMSSLVRTSIGPFPLETAIAVEDLTLPLIQEHLQPAALAVNYLPQLGLTAVQVQELATGRPLRVSQPVDPGNFAAVDARGELIAILEQANLHELRVVRNFAPLLRPLPS